MSHDHWVIKRTEKRTGRLTHTNLMLLCHFPLKITRIRTKWWGCLFNGTISVVSWGPRGSSHFVHSEEQNRTSQHIIGTSSLRISLRNSDSTNSRTGVIHLKMCSWRFLLWWARNHIDDSSPLFRSLWSNNPNWNNFDFGRPDGLILQNQVSLWNQKQIGNNSLTRAYARTCTCDNYLQYILKYFL